jgi:hypothetical protein
LDGGNRGTQIKIAELKCDTPNVVERVMMNGMRDSVENREIEGRRLEKVEFTRSQED